MHIAVAISPAVLLQDIEHRLLQPLQAIGRVTILQGNLITLEEAKSIDLISQEVGARLQPLDDIRVFLQQPAGVGGRDLVFLKRLQHHIVLPETFQRLLPADGRTYADSRDLLGDYLGRVHD